MIHNVLKMVVAFTGVITMAVVSYYLNMPFALKRLSHMQREYRPSPETINPVKGIGENVKLITKVPVYRKKLKNT